MRDPYNTKKLESHVNFILTLNVENIQIKNATYFNNFENLLKILSKLKYIMHF